MREILFRGKTKIGEWFEGYYIVMAGKHYIYSVEDAVHYEVIPETIGQYTGFTDKNGKKVFDGDIVKSEIGTYVVKFLVGSFCCSLIETEYLTLLSTISVKEVIGNIHDNPELLKK